jgi:hypothetical protein
MDWVQQAELYSASMKSELDEEDSDLLAELLERMPGLSAERMHRSITGSSDILVGARASVVATGGSMAPRSDLLIVRGKFGQPYQLGVIEIKTGPTSPSRGPSSTEIETHDKSAAKEPMVPVRTVVRKGSTFVGVATMFALVGSALSGITFIHPVIGVILVSAAVAFYLMASIANA